MTTFDHVYEATKRLEDVYPAIAAELLDVAKIAATTAAATADDAGDGVDDGEDDFSATARTTISSHPSPWRTTATW